MYILMISRGIPSAKDPQWGCFEQDQAEALQRYGHKVVVASVDSRFLIRWRKIGITYEHKNGVDYYNSFWIPNKIISLLGRKIGLCVRKKQLNRVYRKIKAIYGKPDIIYSHYLPNSFLALTLKEKYSIPIVGIEHWSIINQPKLTNEVQYLGNIVYNSIDGLLAVSSSLANSIQKKFNKEAIVVHNMIGKEFANAEMIDNTRKNKFRFLAIGSLIPRKGFDLLIEAFEKAKLHEKDCELVIIGGGTEKENLQKQIDSLSLSNHVKLVGRKNKMEIISHLRESNTFVLSSHVETFSVVCIEALSIGVPVIATACGGPEEFIQETDGLLVKPGSVDELSSAMLQMYQNYKDYDRLAISEDCKRRFSPSVIAKQLTEIFDDVVDSRRKTN